MNAEDGSSGNTSSKIVAKGTTEPELICDKIILLELGKHLARISPILPPNRPLNEAPTISMVQRNAIFSWEKPISSSHNGANDKASQGNDLETP